MNSIVGLLIFIAFVLITAIIRLILYERMFK